MDILVRIRDFWISFISSLNPNITSFIIRMGLMLFITTTLLSISLFYLPSRSVFVQTIIACIGVFIALYIPTEVFRTGSQGNYAFLVTFFFLCMVFLPNWLPASLVPRYGDQLKLKKILRWIVWALFILQIITG